MYDVSNLERFSELMIPLEERYPILSLWRIQKDGGNSPRLKDHFSPIVRNLRRVKHSVLRCRTPKMGQIVFYASANTPSTLGAILPMIEEFARRGVVPFIVTNKKTEVVNEYGFAADTVDYRRWFARISRPRRKLIKSKSKMLAEKVARIFGCEYDLDFAVNLEVAMSMEESATVYLRNASALVVETDYFPVPKGLVFGASRIGIPVIMVQHGFFGVHQFPMHCDAFLAWGEYFKTEARRYGMKKGIGRIAGCPRWDSIDDMRLMREDEGIASRLGREVDKPLVLLLSTAHAAGSSPEVFHDYFLGVRRLLESELRVAMKLHPSEKGLDVYRRHIPGDILKNMKLVTQDITLYDAIRHSDVIYNVMSTAALEAMLFKKPVLFATNGEGFRFTDFPNYGGGEWCPEGQIVDACKRYGVSGGEREQILRKQEEFLKQAVSYRGCSTARSADIIESIISEGAVK